MQKKVLKITQNYSALAEFISLGQVVPALNVFWKKLMNKWPVWWGE